VGIRSLLFETPEPAPAPASLFLTEALAQPPNPKLLGSYFYSRANLDQVEKIMPCQRFVCGQQQIMGLLFEHFGGRQSCVGQIRLDCIGSPLQLAGHHSFWLAFSENGCGPFVSTIELSHVEPTRGLSWLEVLLCGNLEWWFSWSQCQVFHMGKSSPVTRLG